MVYSRQIEEGGIFMTITMTAVGLEKLTAYPQSARKLSFFMGGSMRISKEGKPFGFQKGHKPFSLQSCFKEGHTPWNKGEKGLQESWNKGKKFPEYSGKNNPNWKGGRIVFGYVKVYRPKHPRAMNGSYVYEHILIIEECLGRYMKPKETIHHINNNKSDNRLENLMVFISQSIHVKFHKLPNSVKPIEIVFDGRKKEIIK